MLTPDNEPHTDPHAPETPDTDPKSEQAYEDPKGPDPKATAGGPEATEGDTSSDHAEDIPWEDTTESAASNRREVDRVIQDHVIWAMGAGLIPIPLMDIAAVTSIQIDMVKKISTLYHQDYSEVEAKAWVSTLAGSAGARLAAESMKFIPGVGMLLGGMTMSALSGATTYALGRVFSQHYESGGTFMNFDPEEVRAYFESQIRAGKAFVENLQNRRRASGNRKQAQSPPPGGSGQSNQAGDAQDQLLKKLQELSRLRESGAITEEEFSTLKSRILEQF